MDFNHSSVCGHPCGKYRSQPASEACIVLSITRCIYHANMIDVALVSIRVWILTILLYVGADANADADAGAGGIT